MPGGNNQVVVPQARQSLDNFKNQVASQLGINLQAYNGDLPAREAGRIGGQMVRSMIQQAEQQLAGGAGGGTTTGGAGFTAATRGATR